MRRVFGTTPGPVLEVEPRQTGKARRSTATPTPSRSRSPRSTRLGWRCASPARDRAGPRLLLNTLPPDYAVPSAGAERRLDGLQGRAWAAGAPGRRGHRKRRWPGRRAAPRLRLGLRGPSGRGRRERQADPARHPAWAGGRGRAPKRWPPSAPKAAVSAPTRRSTRRAGRWSRCTRNSPPARPRPGSSPARAAVRSAELSAGPSGRRRCPDRLSPGRSRATTRSSSSGSARRRPPSRSRRPGAGCAPPAPGCAGRRRRARSAVSPTRCCSTAGS